MLSPPSIDIAQPSTSCGSADGQWPTERPLGEDLCSTYLQPEPWNPRLPLYLEDLASARQQWHCNQAARSHSYSRLIKMCHFASQRCELEVLCPKLRYTWVWLVTGWKFSEHGRIYKSYQQWPTEELRERSRSQNGLEGEPLEVPSQKNMELMRSSEKRRQFQLPPSSTGSSIIKVLLPIIVRLHLAQCLCTKLRLDMSWLNCRWIPNWLLSDLQSNTRRPVQGLRAIIVS